MDCTHDAPTIAAWYWRRQVEYLREATEALISCRRVLKNTYPYAFFLEKGLEKNLFENLQVSTSCAGEAAAAAACLC